MNRLVLLWLPGLFLVTACAASRQSAHDAWDVPLLASPNASGGFAHATLLAEGKGTRVDLFFTAAGPQPTIPLHVYTFLYEGNCAQLPARAAFELNDRVLVRTVNGEIASSRRGAFTLSHAVELPLAELATGRYALALRAAPADGGELLYCANLQRA